MLRMDARVQKEGGQIMKAAIYCRLSKEDEDKIEIEEIKYSIGDYIRVPVAKFEKEKKIMEELAELVKAAVGSVYVTGDGTLKITSLINQKDTRKLDYELKKGNVLSYLEEWIDEKENNKENSTYAVSYFVACGLCFVICRYCNTGICSKCKPVTYTE